MMDQAEQDAIDARRWRAVRKRYALALCRLATDSTSYSSTKAPGLLDAWADMAAAGIEAFDPEQWVNVEVPTRIAELGRDGECCAVRPSGEDEDAERRFEG